MFVTNLGALFLIIVMRYFLFAGGVYWLCWRQLRARLSGRRINPRFPPNGALRREIAWSLATSVIFALSGAIILWMWEAGLTRIYDRLDQYGYWYLPASILVMMFLHETYFYWTHRWMHRPAIFRKMHYAHHESRNPSPWAAFSFHPYEAIVEAAVFPLLVITVPSHPAALLTFLMIMTVLSVINHTGYELYPRGFARHSIGRWIISATHHYQHHATGKGNYGLYFTCWDRWLKTEKADYADFYDRVLGNPTGPVSAALDDEANEVRLRQNPHHAVSLRHG